METKQSRLKDILIECAACLFAGALYGVALVVGLAP